MNRLSRRLWVVLIAALLASGACAPPQATNNTPKPGATVRPPPATATPVPPSPDQALRNIIETRYIPAMSPALAELVKKQPWYNNKMTPARAEMIAQAQKSEKAAQPRGEVRSVASILQFASEQPWYQDGMDDREATVLAAVFEAYGVSLADANAPALGPILSSTLKQSLFEVVQLPESGSMVLLVSAEKPELGKQALTLGIDALPQIEKVVGKYPYHFLHMEVTADLPKIVLGASYNEFIELRTDSVNAETVDHEVTHSTLYGDFPLWFEEGFAHFLQYYLTNGLDSGLIAYRQQLARNAVDPRLDIRPSRGGGERQQLIDRARGFLFVKALYDIKGIEGMGKLVRTLRTHTYTDQDLMRAIVADGSVEEQEKVQALVCKLVVGSVRNYCVPGR